jgi:hypothetical protein
MIIVGICGLGWGCVKVLRRERTLGVWRVGGGEELAIFQAKTVNEQANRKFLLALYNVKNVFRTSS